MDVCESCFYPIGLADAAAVAASFALTYSATFPAFAVDGDCSVDPVLLETLEQQLSGDEKTAFFTEQRSWVRDRESTAVANSKKQSGSALEELEYIRSLSDLTRERVYDLAGRYETILDKTE